MRMAVSSSDLYVVFILSDAGSNLAVNRYDGSNWYELPDVQNQANASVSTADIAIYNNEPVVAFTENNKLIVKMYSDQAVSGLSKEISGNPMVKLYPNPFKNVFDIDLGQIYSNVRLKIMSITRKIMKE